jgi:hypothetical protein
MSIGVQPRLRPEMTPEIDAFCLRLGVRKHVPIAIQIVEESFSSARELALEREQDPETGEEWLVLDLTISGGVDDFLREYDQFTEKKVRMIPWPEVLKIRLSWHFNDESA